MSHDYMLDLETLGTNIQTCPILQITMVKFDLFKDYHTAEQLLTLPYINMIINLKNQPNTNIEPDTLQFWLNQHPRLFELVAATNKSEQHDALYNINDFIDKTALPQHTDLKIWCRGQDFDLPILNHRYNLYNIRPSWTYDIKYDFNVKRHNTGRDVRTVIDLCQQIYPEFTFRKMVKPNAIKHDAYYDCLHQIHQLTQAAWQLKQM
jgi:hypothetical protein